MPVALPKLYLKTVLQLTCCIAFAALARAADDAPWQVAKVSGPVFMISVDAQQLALTSEQQVKAGDTIRTGRNGRVMLVRGAEAMTLSSNTSIEIPAGEGRYTSTIRQQAGTVDLEVKKENVQHFEVQTPNLAAVVKGTHFRIEVVERASRVTVSRGQVEVTDYKTGDRVQMLRNQSVSVSESGRSRLLFNGRGPFNPIEHGTPQASPVHFSNPARLAQERAAAKSALERKSNPNGAGDSRSDQQPSPRNQGSGVNAASASPRASSSTLATPDPLVAPAGDGVAMAPAPNLVGAAPLGAAALTAPAATPTQVGGPTVNAVTSVSDTSPGLTPATGPSASGAAITTLPNNAVGAASDTARSAANAATKDGLEGKDSKSTNALTPPNNAVGPSANTGQAAAAKGASEKNAVANSVSSPAAKDGGDGKGSKEVKATSLPSNAVSAAADTAQSAAAKGKSDKNAVANSASSSATKDVEIARQRTELIVRRKTEQIARTSSRQTPLRVLVTDLRPKDLRQKTRQSPPR